ncbi:MAG TPA: response regulator transcription factor [Ktedonobacterales bacterium]
MESATSNATYESKRPARSTETEPGSGPQSAQSAQSVQSARPRILIIDDHPIFCDGLQALLERSGRFEVVGQAWSSADALSAARELKPDIVLLDIELDNKTVNGLDLVHRLRGVRRETKIIVLTAHTGGEFLMYALRLGVQAFLQKDMPPRLLLDAVSQVQAGERVLPNPHHVTVALTELDQAIQERDRAHSGLSDQEIEMLRMAASGHKNKAIGDQEYWSEITVKRKMQTVYKKLGVSSRAQAVAEAIRLGLI